MLEQASLNLAQCDRQWLFALLWGYQWADKFEYAFVLLLVVAVDLTRALGGEDHQGVLRGHLGQQLVNRRIGDADRLVEDG